MLHFRRAIMPEAAKGAKIAACAKFVRVYNSLLRLWVSKESEGLCYFWYIEKIMIINVSGRQAGKTTQAVNWVIEGRRDGKRDTSSRILAVMSLQEKDRIMQRYDLGPHEVETWDTLRHRYHLPGAKSAGIDSVWVDNADLFISQLFPEPFRVAGITMTEGNEIMEQSS